MAPTVSRFVHAFADGVLAADLPALPVDRRRATADFATGRIARLPSPMRIAVGAVALAVGAAGSVLGHGRIAGRLARTPVPVLGDYVRLVRSLGYAYVWETWPTTRADGSAP